MLVFRIRAGRVALVGCGLFLFVLAILFLAASKSRVGRILTTAAERVEEGETLRDITAVRRELEEIFKFRVQALVEGDTGGLEKFYDTSETTGRWALNHEIGRSRYVQGWLGKRDLEVAGKLLHLNIVDAGFKDDQHAWASVAQHLILQYRPRNTGQAVVSEMGLRTIHWVELVEKNNRWLIQKDWYWDPFENESLTPDIAPRPAGGAETARPPDPVTPDSSRGQYNREAAVRYAERYSGVRMGPGDGRYNPAYKDFTYEGGDCANFVSQVLTDKKAGGLPTDWNWFYSRGEGTAAWVQAEALVHHLTGAGLAALVGRGDLEEVWEAVDLLQPGDVIGYEEDGEIVHVSVVVGRNAHGYVMVNSHTADRYHVPWDMGWEREHRYWLLHITY
ncbi:MAG: amidase domain-containing protein [Thermoanaerobacteraceae bacterium]|nr:amidase domain-containing protein [Thermoanaerobacteraceae bacterium]